VIDETGRPSVHLSKRAQNWKLGPKQRAPVLVPGEGRTVVTEVARERHHAVAGVGQFENARDDEANIALGIGGRREDGKLLEIRICQVNSAYLRSSAIVDNEGVQISEK